MRSISAETLHACGEMIRMRAVAMLCCIYSNEAERIGIMANRITNGAPEAATVAQAFGSLAPSRIGLGEAVRAKSVAALNRLLAHTMAMRDLYKKSHWQTSGPTFYELHLLFDKHHGEQLEIMDALAERVQTLG